MEKYRKPNNENFVDKITNKDLKPKKKLKENQMFESLHRCKVKKLKKNIRNNK